MVCGRRRAIVWAFIGASQWEWGYLGGGKFVGLCDYFLSVLELNGSKND